MIHLDASRRVQAWPRLPRHGLGDQCERSIPRMDQSPREWDAEHGRHPTAQVRDTRRRRRPPPSSLLPMSDRRGPLAIRGTTSSTFLTDGSSTGATPSSTRSGPSTTSSEIARSRKRLTTFSTAGWRRFRRSCISASGRPGCSRSTGFVSSTGSISPGSKTTGSPVGNYRAQLTILDEEFVDVEWLHSQNGCGIGRRPRGQGPAGLEEVPRTASLTGCASGPRRSERLLSSSRPPGRPTPTCF